MSRLVSRILKGLRTKESCDGWDTRSKLKRAVYLYRIFLFHAAMCVSIVEKLWAEIFYSFICFSRFLKPFHQWRFFLRLFIYFFFYPATVNRWGLHTMLFLLIPIFFSFQFICNFKFRDFYRDVKHKHLYSTAKLRILSICCIFSGLNTKIIMTCE